MILNNLILPYDYILLSIIFIIIIFSLLKGFIQSLLGLLTWVGSIIITIYTYENFSKYLSKQILKIEIFKDYDNLTNIFSLVLSVPIIFLITLFLLKTIRRFISLDLEKNIVGIIFDKIFGFIYGIIFSYIILTSILILLNRFKYNSTINWIDNNSFIIKNINNFNDKNIKFIYSNSNIKRD